MDQSGVSGPTEMEAKQSQQPGVNNGNSNSVGTIDLTTPPTTPPTNGPEFSARGGSGPSIGPPPPLSGKVQDPTTTSSNGEVLSSTKLPALVVHSESEGEGEGDEEGGVRGEGGGVKRTRPPMALRISASSDDEEAGQLVLSVEEDHMEKEDSPMEDDCERTEHPVTSMAGLHHGAGSIDLAVPSTSACGGVASKRSTNSASPDVSNPTAGVDSNERTRPGASDPGDKPLRGHKEGLSAKSLSDGILGEEGVRGENARSYRVRQVAKVKRFFTTLQGFGNNMSPEVAEQVQELITALVNGTATIEEFHQEIQTVTNHPLKDFIIPFLRENLGLFREELKESSQALSDLLGGPSTTVGMSPQLEEDEIPVLPSAKPGSAPITPLTSAAPAPFLAVSTSGSKQPTTSSSSSVTPSHPHLSTPSHPHSSTPSLPHMDTGGESGPDYGPVGGPGVRKRQRRPSMERNMMLTEGESPFPGEKGASGFPHKRPRPHHDHAPSNPAETSVITTPGTQRHHHPPPPPTYHTPHPSHPLPPPSHPHTSQAEVPGGLTYIPVDQARRSLMSEDWGHLDLMLGSVLGMVERCRQAVAMLKDRVMPEMDKKESELEAVVKQRVHEAVEKERKQNAEEKQQILMDASKQLRDTVAQVRGEMESRIAQRQALSVREALKENNVQTSSKESCWNCGRRATETCSGCNKARYCGTFCQHKDWGNHMHHCASGLQATTVVKQEPATELPVAMPTTAVVMPTSSSNVIMVPSPSGMGTAVLGPPVQFISRNYTDTRAS